jgi:hypothetical protein
LQCGPWMIPDGCWLRALLKHLDNDLEKLQNSMLHPQNFLALNNCDLGYQFAQELREHNIPTETVTEIKQKSVDFLKVLITEFVKRMPSHLKVFTQIKNIHPKTILNAIRPKFSELLLNLVRQKNLSDLETQYRLLLSVRWDEIFARETPED